MLPLPVNSPRTPVLISLRTHTLYAWTNNNLTCRRLQLVFINAEHSNLGDDQAQIIRFIYIPQSGGGFLGQP